MLGPDPRTDCVRLLPWVLSGSVTQSAHPYRQLHQDAQVFVIGEKKTGPSLAPLAPAAFAAKTDYCTLAPEFDAADLKILIRPEAKFSRSFPNI